MLEKKRIFISDVHMNAGIGFNASEGTHSYEWLNPSEAQRFADFLKYINNPSEIKEVIFIGDLMDNWVYPIDIDPPTFPDIINAPINADIVKELKTLCSNKEIGIFYLPGNHDMGMTKEIVNENFSQMVFGGSSLQNSRFTSGRLQAEHGSAYAMFNAPDPINSPGNRLPLGYFISRVVATAQHRTGVSKRHYWSYADDMLEMLGPQKIASSVFEAITEEAGLDESDEIIMSNRGCKKITIRVGEVKQKYAALYEQWTNQYGPGIAFKSVMAEIGYLGNVADRLCKKNGINLIIFGHSHDWKLDKDSLFVEDRIYANCGTWCDESKPCTYVETQKDTANNRHIIRIMDWNNGKPKSLKEEAV